MASINGNKQILLQPEKKKENDPPQERQISKKKVNSLNFIPRVPVLPPVLQLYLCRQIRCTRVLSKIS